MQIKHYDNPLMEVPQPRASNAVRLTLARFRLFPVRSPLLGESFLLSFPPVTEMFQFTGSPLVTLCIHVTMIESSSTGLLHSETYESQLLAAPRSYRLPCVLLRRHVPRHPPRALLDLTRNIFLYLVVKVQLLFLDGPGWTRTIDLTLIRRAL